MTRYDTEALINSTNLIDLIGGTVKLRRVGRDWVGLCPFHSERTPSFNVIPEKQMFHCFGCGANGNAINWLMDYEGLSFKEACEELGGKPQRRTKTPTNASQIAPEPKAWGGQGVMRGRPAVLILDEKPSAEELTIALACYPDHDIIWFPDAATAAQMQLAPVAWEKLAFQPHESHSDEIRHADLVTLIEQYRANSRNRSE